MATIGVEQHTFRTTVMGCVGGCDPIGNPKKPLLGIPIGDKISEKNYHWGFGLATIGVKQHTFRTTVFVCVCVVPSGLGGGGSSQATGLQRELDNV